MMEALACGTPVVASAVGSIPDFVTTASGKLSRPLDHADLAAKLDECLATHYDRKAIRGHVQEFSWNACAGKYLTELRGLVEEGRKPALHLLKRKGDV
jgi:glycosyltransferase involved in cell wall biosynthesis